MLVSNTVAFRVMRLKKLVLGHDKHLIILDNDGFSRRHGLLGLLPVDDKRDVQFGATAVTSSQKAWPTSLRRSRPQLQRSS